MTPSPRREELRAAGAAAAAIALLVLASWVPFGFNVGPTLDEWRCFGAIAAGQQMVPATHPGHLTRPFVFLPYVLAYRLSPDSFRGLNLVMAVSMFLKGFFLYTFVRQLAPERPASFALLSGALFTLYPAHGSAFWGSAISYPFSQAFFLLALVSFLSWRRSRRLVFLVVAALAIAIPCGTSENAFPFALLAPVLFRADPCADDRHFWRDSALWLAVPVVFMAHYVKVAATSQGSYQATLLSRPSMPEAIASVVRAFGFVLLGAWTLLVQWDAGTQSVGLCVAVGAVVGVVAFRQGRVVAEPSRPFLSGRGLLALGLVVVLVGYLPYLPTLLRDVPSRTMAYSSMGGALLWGLAIDRLAAVLGGRRIVYGSAAAILSGAALSKGLAQHRYYRDWARSEQAILRPIARSLEPGVRAGAVVLIDGVSESVIADAVFESALGYLLRAPRLRAVRCGPEGCRSAETGMLVAGAEGIPSDTPLVVPYERAILFRADARGIPRLVTRLPARWHVSPEADAHYRPEALLEKGGGPAPRLRTALEAPTVESPGDADTTPCPFRWKFAGPIPSGHGWEAAAPGGSKLWTVAQRATMNFRLDTAHDHRLKIVIAYALSAETLASLRLEVNGVPVVLQRAAPKDVLTRSDVFTAEIPRALVALDPEITELAFLVDRLDVPPPPSTDRRALGLLFDRLALEPIPSPAPD